MDGFYGLEFACPPNQLAKLDVFFLLALMPVACGLPYHASTRLA
jgi:hypothetical protein